MECSGLTGMDSVNRVVFILDFQLLWKEENRTMASFNCKFNPGDRIRVVADGSIGSIATVIFGEATSVMYLCRFPEGPFQYLDENALVAFDDLEPLFRLGDKVRRVDNIDLPKKSMTVEEIYITNDGVLCLCNDGERSRLTINQRLLEKTPVQ